VSISLPYGVLLRALVDKFVNSRFEPSGYTPNPELRYAKSIVDYIGRWLGGKFISRNYLDDDAVREPEPPRAPGAVRAKAAAFLSAKAPAEGDRPAGLRGAVEDAPYCSECGMLMTPNGSCYKCSNCGSTSGCS
jgi:ribonucleoside-diphosphate reductase alpha chain